MLAGVRIPDASLDSSIPFRKESSCNANCELRDKRAFLRVKLKSLAAEARIIRREEARNKRLRYELSEYRRGVVRAAARNTQLAYAFLKGRTYRSIEAKATTPPNWKEVERMVSQYGVQRDYENQSHAEHEKAVAAQSERFKRWPDAT